MNNTRRTKTFIGAMMLAAAGTAGYAAFVSHTLHAYFALAVLGAGGGNFANESETARNQRQHVSQLAVPADGGVSLSAAEAAVIACVSTAVQCWPRKNAKFNPQQMTFNLSMMVFATSWQA